MDLALLVTGTACGFLHSVYSALSKLVLKRGLKTPLLFLLYVNVFQALGTLVLWTAVRPTLPGEGLVPLLAAGGTCVLAYIFLYASLACGDGSSVLPIMGS